MLAEVFVVDGYSRAIVGWCDASNKRTGLVLGLWRHDCHDWPLGPGLIHHSDAVPQYTSVAGCLPPWRTCPILALAVVYGTS